MIKSTINNLLQKARDVVDVAQSLRHDAFQDIRNTRRHSEYTEFLILGRSRSGSNFLRGLLNSHPRVIAFGELFQNDSAIGWGLSGYPETPQLLTQFRNDPVAFLETQVFCEVPKAIDAVGFKIFYYHAHNEKWQPVWEYLAAQSRLKVIHIKRNNLLKVHLSRKRALLTDRWVNVSGRSEEYPPIALDYNECLDDFLQTRKWEREYASFFSNHALLDIHYEALASDWEGEMERVENFLEIKPERLIPETHQQSDQLLTTSISNYDELKEKFTGTEWQPFFEA